MTKAPPSAPMMARPLHSPSRPRLWRIALAAVLAGGGWGWSGAAQPAGDTSAWAELQQADAAQGRRLMAQHKCSDCHARRVGGDGSAIYRPTGRISRPAALLAMVEMCNTELNLQLFPDDVAAIAAALNQAHYRFTAPAKP